MVDDVCIYNEKVDEKKREYESKDEKEKENLPHELENIPLRTVPLKFNPDDPKYRVARPVKLENEIGEPAGLLGWCFVCRGPANLFCKDTRIPICSVECKLQHLEELSKLLYLISTLYFKVILTI